MPLCPFSNRGAVLALLALQVISMNSLIAADQEVSAAQLISISPHIAVVTIERAPAARVEEASLDPGITKQRVPARTVRVLKGSLPSQFRIENEEDSLITAGTHLAFLRHLHDDCYVLSSSVSLRKIENGSVYWFPHTWVPFGNAEREIQQPAQSGGASYSSRAAERNGPQRSASDKVDKP